MTTSVETRPPWRNRWPAPAGRRAFSLIEVLLVIALLGLVGALFISGGKDLFRAHEQTATDVFWQAVQRARLLAVQQDAIVTFHYDEKNHMVVWGSDASTQNLAWPGKNLEFLPMERKDTILLGGRLVESDQLMVVRFYADGGVDRFRAQLTDAAGQVSLLELDPWTCAPVLRNTP